MDESITEIILDNIHIVICLIIALTALKFIASSIGGGGEIVFAKAIADSIRNPKVKFRVRVIFESRIEVLDDGFKTVMASTFRQVFKSLGVECTYSSGVIRLVGYKVNSTVKRFERGIRYIVEVECIGNTINIVVLREV